MIDVILLSGASGAGKSTVCHAFEERGFRIVENVPLGALPATIDAMVANPSYYAKVALILTLDQLKDAQAYLRTREDIDLTVVILDCGQHELLSRFRLTRHVHPLQSQGLSLEEAILKDKETITHIRPVADLYLDTTGMDVATLREVALANIEGEEISHLVVRFTSFGYKYGVPRDAETIFDCRNVPNPFWIKELRPLTGLDQPIIDWLEKHEETEESYQEMVTYLTYYLAKARKDKRNYVSISLGCSGGQHRSVYFAERLYNHFKNEYKAFVTHREIARYKGK